MALPVDRQTQLEKPSESYATESSSFSSKQEHDVGSLDIETEPKGEALAPARSEEGQIYPKGVKLALILASIYIAVFLMALDRTIIATAVPQITNDFNSFGDVGWYVSAFLLTSAAFQLFLGRLYTFYSPKWVFLSLIFVFEVGSLLCAVAPNSVSFIVGRAISGIGSAGIVTGAIVLLMFAVPLQKRPMFTGFVGAIFGVASVAGPLLGGVFTTKVTWRWCFYINLPLGGVAMAFIFFFLEAPAPRQGGLSIKDQVKQLDPLGTAVFLPAIVSLILALQWGGSTYDWSDWRIILLFVMFGVLIVAFIAIQIWKGETATVPPRIICQRSIAAGFWFMIMTGASFMVIVYYLPIWFQAIKDDTAINSGISTLPNLLALVIASVSTGIIISKVGYYTPSLLTGSVLMSIGAGLFTLFKVNTRHPMWIGVQVLFGLGIGAGMQQSNTAAQTVLNRKDSPTGVAIMMFGMTLGGSISSSVAQNILNNKLIAGLSSIPGFDARSIVNTGATELRHKFAADQLPQVLGVYNNALTDVFFISVVTSCLSIIGSGAMEWRSVRTKKKGEEEH